MTASTNDKHMDQVEGPTGQRLGICYSTLKVARHQSLALERAGYKILDIVSVALPKPNV